MKLPHEMSEKELLIRIDERTECLPELKKQVNRHQVLIAVLFVIIAFIGAGTYPWLSTALGRLIQ